MAQLGQRLEKYGEFVMDTYLLFSSVYNAPSSFSKSKRSLSKRSLSMTLDNSGRRAWRVPRSLHLKDLLDFEKELGAL
jgi:hypothetical protein